MRNCHHRPLRISERPADRTPTTMVLFLLVGLTLTTLPKCGAAAPLPLPEYTAVIRSMVVDGAGRLWIGSFGAGV